jgi:hypothetical protein
VTTPAFHENQNPNINPDGRPVQRYTTASGHTFNVREEDLEAWLEANPGATPVEQPGERTGQGEEAPGRRRGQGEDAPGTRTRTRRRGAGAGEEETETPETPEAPAEA